MNFYSNIFTIPLAIDETGKSTRKKLTQFKNNLSFINNFSRFVNDALGRYGLENLPDTINERVLLQSFLWYGKACIYKKKGALIGLPCAPSSAGLTVYGDYASAFTYSANGIIHDNVKLYVHGSDDASFLGKGNGAIVDTELKGVLIRENALMYPFINIVIQFAECVADTYRTIDVCRTHLKRPFILVGEESQQAEIKRFLESMENNSPDYLNSGVFDVNKIQSIPIDINGNSLNDATQLVEWYENKFRELCGINSNGQMDKKGENLIQAEISINDDYEMFNVEKSIKYIQEGLDDVNKLFGTNIKVKERERNENISGDSTDNNIPDNGRRNNTSDNI